MHWQSAKALEPTGEEKLAGHATERLLLPPGQ
jgi:hypothetical protein